jgi:hypothetical protein
VQYFPLKLGGPKVEKKAEGIVRRLEIRAKLSHMHGDQSVIRLQLDDGGPFHNQVEAMLSDHHRAIQDLDLPLALGRKTATSKLGKQRANVDVLQEPGAKRFVNAGSGLNDLAKEGTGIHEAV